MTRALRDAKVIIAATYAVVLVSILVQALTLSPLVRMLQHRRGATKAHA